MNQAKTALALAVLATALLLPTPAEACSCGGGWPLSAGVKETPTIFVGTAVEVTGQMPTPVVAAFVIEKTYRGQTYFRTVVSGDGNNCDINFVVGETYFVYAREHDGALKTHKCTRTRVLAEAAEDVRYVENLAAGRPQAIVHGEVLEASTLPDGTPAGRGIEERLTVVAESAGVRRTVKSGKWGPYQLVLAPGEYRLWVERQGERLTEPTTVSLRADEARRMQFTIPKP